MIATATAADEPDRRGSGVHLDGDTTIIRSMLDGSDVRIRVHSHVPPVLDLDGRRLDPVSARLVAQAVGGIAQAITPPPGWPEQLWSDRP